ncbi:hypothetical protein M9H77_26009 [Catharanthus roseus]|uniref:Uncharacterized protein n=1 Tax=Catharanthus roseus TaxID=4058 RepID=A0ACC0A9F9_CATRO|nr:hypothetical protein M9H77_26009 [Catharanthus roseus]
MDKFSDCARAPMLNRLRRELGGVIIHYPNRNHNGIKVTFILVHLGLATGYCHREKASFMTFSTLMQTYLKLFEADGLYTLYYERFFCFESHCIPIIVVNAAVRIGLYFMYFHPQCLYFFCFYFSDASRWKHDMYCNIISVDVATGLYNRSWG